MTSQKSYATLGLGQIEIGKSTIAKKKIIVLVQIGGETVVLLRSGYSKKSF